ncbi:MAG TPA: nucleotide exchange factor GrpE [Terriglobales bacterium]|nr:nucleotide exchange factor GrpE [Terriglobales bacterium]
MGRTEQDVQEESLQQQDQNDEQSPVQPDQAAEQLQKLQAERDALYERVARQQAEFENYRKRSQKEQQDYRDYALTDFAKQFLPVLDSFDRALNSQGSDADLRKGMELIRRQMEDALARIGVKTVPAKGEQFDPHVHEAIEMVETEDAPDNEVLDELARGYMIKDRLLRPAMVRVAKNHK